MLNKGQNFMTCVLDVVKASYLNSSVVKRPSPVRVWALPMILCLGYSEPDRENFLNPVLKQPRSQR